MLRVKIEYRVFQNDKLDEEVECEERFTDANELAQTLARFVAEQSGVRLNELVIPLYTGGQRMLHPPCRGGYGPHTHLVINWIEVF